MKISVNWIKEFMPDFPVNNEADAQKISDKLALTSTEVEDKGYQIPQSTGLVVGQVLEVRSIENSTHLKITIVNAGKKDYQVVTGAPNVVKGQLVVLALPGAHLPENKLIEATELDGQISQGMLVSLQEIGFDDAIAPKKHEAGIYVFPADSEVQPGDDAVKVLGIDDLMIDTELTANRGDMLSIRGNLYEFSALFEKDFKKIDFDLQESAQTAASQLSASVDPTLANPYYLRIVNHVTVKESPLWLQRRLWNSGIRPINNLVDVTNYVMLLLGQPMHVFDLDQLHHHEIRVALSSDETITTLDGEKRQLKAGEDIVVYDGQDPQMLAGVMGGSQSEVTENTSNVVLESAVFNPVLIRKTARRFNLHSQASQRFERGIDVSNSRKALDYAAALIKDLAGGEIAQGVIEAQADIAKEKQIAISLGDINGYLGTQAGLDDVADIWRRLSFTFEQEGENFLVMIPRRRPDITIKADLIEEFVRIYGYEKIPAHLPQAVNQKSGLTADQKLDRSIREILLALGLTQAISYSLTTTEFASQFTSQARPLVKLAYPMSQEHAVMRQSVLATLIQAAAYNAARKISDIRLFETGDVFYGRPDNDPDQLPIEKQQIAAVISGKPSADWQHNDQNYDFYDIKGLLTALLSKLNLKGKILFKKSQSQPEMHPGQTADVYLDDQYLGFVGQINPQLANQYKLGRTFVFQLDSNLVHDRCQHGTDYRPLDKFPAIERDLSLLVDKNLQAADIVSIITKNAGSYLRQVNLVDVYEGTELGQQKKSLSYRLQFVNPDATLTDEIVNAAMARISTALFDQLQVTTR
ncbi:phenylalanine--tRNA ligase subunit beta [Oenococcus sp.]|uniref:phenylalanine--tRNA ligase subunit beta n=1 Tax=Oenococcus sp. TaxID=1979414 RepID=UPI0039EBC5C7